MSDKLGLAVGGDYIKRWTDESGVVRYTMRVTEVSLVQLPIQRKRWIDRFTVRRSTMFWIGVAMAVAGSSGFIYMFLDLLGGQLVWR